MIWETAGLIVPHLLIRNVGGLGQKISKELSKTNWDKLQFSTNVTQKLKDTTENLFKK